MAKASIIIPVWNLREHVELCLRSVRENTRYPHKIICVDDSSDDGTREWLETQEDITLIKNDANYGWFKSLNIGIKHEKADYYVFLDRDCIVTPNWLTKLIECFEKIPNAGIVSPTSGAGNAEQSLPQGIYDGIVHQFFKDHNPHTPCYVYWLLPWEKIMEFGRLVEEHYRGQWIFHSPLQFFCVVLPHRTIETVGLLDERFKAQQGDFYYSAMCEKAGLRCIVRMDVYVHHFKWPPLTPIERAKLLEMGYTYYDKAISPIELYGPNRGAWNLRGHDGQLWEDMISGKVEENPYKYLKGTTGGGRL